METAAELQRSVSQQSASSIRSRRSATVRAARGRKLVSQPSSSAGSISPSDKSLTSFPSFSPESPAAARFRSENKQLVQNDARQDETNRNGDGEEEERLRTATQQDPQHNRGFRSESIVESLTGASAARGSLFEDAPVTKVPGALHQADDKHIERLIARHGAVGLVRQIAEDLAQRDAQIATLRRRADERERALRRIVRECGLSNMELETRLRTVEEELRESGRARSRVDSGLSDMMSDAMQDTMMASAYGHTGLNGSDTLRAGGSTSRPGENGKGTARGWKDYFWGTGTAKKSRGSSVNGEGAYTASAIRSSSSLDKRPGLQDDLFNPPDADAMSRTTRSSSRPTSIHSMNPDRKGSGSLASLALRLVAGGAMNGREAETRGRASSSTGREFSGRAASVATGRSVQSTRSASVAGGPKALMAMRRSSQAPSAQASTTSRSQASEMWDTMAGSPPSANRQESYGPVEMDAILPPESQPPTLTHIYNNYDNSEFLTDRFGFIYDQRRKKRQREAAQMARHIRKGSRTEMLINGRTGISPNLLDDAPPSPKWSVSSEGRPGSQHSGEDKDPNSEENKPKRWQDYLKIATFPTELLSHTPSMGAPSLEVLEAAEVANADVQPVEVPKTPAITPTGSGLVPTASTTTAVDTAVDGQVTPASETVSTPEPSINEDREPVKLLLQQLSELHDTLQSKKTPQWNDFLRKVRAERKREGEAAIAAANAAAEARYERPAVILPETRVADGEMIGIAGLGNKGKVGRNKWNEFKSLVLGGIPVAYRAKIWSECSGATALRVPGNFEDLVAQSSEDDDPAVLSQIDMDIHRTLTDNIFFRKGPGVQKLREVLVAYARRNRDVGYCQGMNLIVANLLLIMPSAEDAFWVLASIVENILPSGYYDDSLMSSRADQQVLRSYVSTVLPKLSAHLDSLSIELETMTFQWFLSVFTDCLCAEALFRVWDVVLCTNDGSTFLFQVALALLKLNEGNLLQCSTPAAVYTYIGHHMTEHAISIDGLMQASEGLRKVVRREEVEAKREAVLKAERDMLAGRHESQGGAEERSAEA